MNRIKKALVSCFVAVFLILPGFSDSTATFTAAAEEYTDNEAFIGIGELPYFYEYNTLDGNGMYYPMGTYKITPVENSDKIPVYSSWDEQSEVLAYVENDKYYFIYDIKYGFGKINEEGISGFIKLDDTTLISTRDNTDFTSAANLAVEFMLTAEDYAELSYEYELLQSLLDEAEQAFIKQFSEEVISRAIKNLNEMRTYLSFRTGQGELPDNWYLYGDADGNALINMADVVCVQKYVAKLIDMDINACISSDVDISDEINLVDVVLIQRYTVHLINVFPAGYYFRVDVV